MAHRPKIFSDQTGLTLIAALVAVAISVIFAFIGAAAFKNNMVAAQNLESRFGYGPFEDLLRLYFARLIPSQVMTYASSGSCATYGTGFQTSFPWTMTTPPLNASLVTSANFSTLTGYVGSAAHEAAKTRCQTRQTFASSPNFSGGASFYSCLLLSNTGATPFLGVSNSYPVFAEINYKLISIESGNGLTCNTYGADKAPGGQVFYTIYWSKSTGGAESPVFYNQYSGVLYVSAF